MLFMSAAYLQKIRGLVHLHKPLSCLSGITSHCCSLQPTLIFTLSCISNCPITTINNKKRKVYWRKSKEKPIQIFIQYFLPHYSSLSIVPHFPSPYTHKTHVHTQHMHRLQKQRNADKQFWSVLELVLPLTWGLFRTVKARLWRNSHIYYNMYVEKFCGKRLAMLVFLDLYLIRAIASLMRHFARSQLHYFSLSGGGGEGRGEWEGGDYNLGATGS